MRIVHAMIPIAVFGRCGDGLRKALDPGAAGRRGRSFRAAQRVFVVIGLGALVLGTMPNIAARHGVALTGVTLVVALLFGLEYAARVWLVPLDRVAVATDRSDGSRGKPRAAAISKRIRWALSPLGLIDLLATVPVPLALAFGSSQETARLLGILWTLKLIRYTSAFGLLVRVVRNERRALVSVMVCFLIVMLLAAAATFVLERDRQPDAFGSIPASLWWAIATLTTTGYGDEVPVTTVGRVLAGTVMISGIGMFALWAGILASGFSQEVRRHAFLKTWDIVAKVPMFHSLGAHTIAEVTKLLRPREVGAGRIVIHKGQPGDSMFFVADGEVRVDVDPVPITLGRGDFFGEMALITGDPRSATVATTKPTTLLQLDIVDFRGLAANTPELMQAIEAEGARRLGLRADSGERGQGGHGRAGGRADQLRGSSRPKAVPPK